MRRNGFRDRKICQSWQRFTQKEGVKKAQVFFKNVGAVLTLTGKWAYQLRSLVLSIPVFVCAGALAIRNARLLPELVGVVMLANGEYQWLVSRGVAVLAPLIVTVVCLLLMLCSKKILYPWLISVFSLVLPLVVWLTNSFSA